MYETNQLNKDYEDLLRQYKSLRDETITVSNKLRQSDQEISNEDTYSDDDIMQFKNKIKQSFFITEEAFL